MFAICRPIIARNKENELKKDYLNTEGIELGTLNTGTTGGGHNSDPFDNLIDMREYDVPYLMRVAIDLNIRVGAW